MKTEPGSTVLRRPPPSMEVAEQLRQDLARNQFRPHDRLPPLRELGRQHGVAVNTIRKALEILEREGLLYRREGNGTFVQPRPVAFTRAAGGSALKCVTIIHGLQTYMPQGRDRDSRLLVGYTQAIEDADLHIRFAIWSETEGIESSELLSNRFSPAEQGCILFDVMSAKLMSWLNDRRVPFVVQSGSAYSRTGLPEHSSVIINKVGAGFEATRHLIEREHRRIGYVGSLFFRGAPNPLWEGWRSALRCSGIEEGQEATVDAVTDTVMPGAPAIRTMLLRSDRPTAIVASNDAVAVTVQNEAKSMGLTLPGDLSVIGYNNDAIASQAQPPLTTMDPPREGLARAAVQMLGELAVDPTRTRRDQVLECRLIRRGSVAAPAIVLTAEIDLTRGHPSKEG